MADVEDVEDESSEDEDTRPVKRKKGTSTSGWCLTGLDSDSHMRCLVTVGSFSCSCACDGHGSRAGEQPLWISQELLIPLDTDDSE